jgi:transposase InsO family protein
MGLNSRGRETAAERRERGIFAVRELRSEFNVSDLVKLTKMPRSSFYYAVSHPKEDKYAEERKLLHKINEDNKGRYGYRRITLAFRNAGKQTNHKVIQKLMREENILCRIKRHKYKSYKGEVGKTAPNILNRNFKAERPNEKWVTDVTQFNVLGKKYYLSPIVDLYDGFVVSWNLSRSPNFEQTMDMLDKAFCKIPDGRNLILHSDQGWQYQMYKYRQRLKEKGIIQSMSRKGNCLDNAVIENFFGLLKKEFYYGRTFESIEQFKTELKEYLKWYNEKRIKLKLKGLSPLQIRRQALISA